MAGRWEIWYQVMQIVSNNIRKKKKSGVQTWVLQGKTPKREGQTTTKVGKTLLKNKKIKSDVSQAAASKKKKKTTTTGQSHSVTSTSFIFLTLLSLLNQTLYPVLAAAPSGQQCTPVPGCTWVR